MYFLDGNVTQHIYKLLRVSAPKCHIYGITTTKGVQAKLLIYVLFKFINLIKTLIVKIYKMYKIYKKLTLLPIYCVLFIR